MPADALSEENAISPREHRTRAAKLLRMFIGEPPLLRSGRKTSPAARRFRSLDEAPGSGSAIIASAEARRAGGRPARRAAGGPSPGKISPPFLQRREITDRVDPLDVLAQFQMQPRRLGRAALPGFSDDLAAPHGIALFHVKLAHVGVGGDIAAG